MSRPHTSDEHDSDHGRDRLLTIAEVADRLGVEVRHIRRLVHERRIPYIKWGHLLRFDRTDIDDWIDANRRQPVNPGRR